MTFAPWFLERGFGCGIGDGFHSTLSVDLDLPFPFLLRSSVVKCQFVGLQNKELFPEHWQNIHPFAQMTLKHVLVEWRLLINLERPKIFHSEGQISKYYLIKEHQNIFKKSILIRPIPYILFLNILQFFYPIIFEFLAFRMKYFRSLQ